jgi:hypothetical protein
MPIPYGYKIEKGKAVIDEAQAEQIRTVYKSYLSGLAYIAAAEAAGLTLLHAGVKSMLQNKRYLGDAYYPAIIDQETYDRAEAERIKRQTRLGRIFPDKPVEECRPATKFIMPKAGKIFNDPFKQAEYAYSLIESEVEK